jgi:hypothetical protein
MAASQRTLLRLSLLSSSSKNLPSSKAFIIITISTALFYPLRLAFTSPMNSFSFRTCTLATLCEMILHGTSLFVAKHNSVIAQFKGTTSRVMKPSIWRPQAPPKCKFFA